MLETIFTAVFTAIAGAIATVWGYWTGRKKTVSENAIRRAEALDKTNEIIDQQAEKLEKLYNIVLALRDENAKLISQNNTLKLSVDTLNKEVEALRQELAQYKHPATKRNPTGNS
jgi:hypothetical protein|nr:hypothetical protein [uncultured Porphyromonas sp.]DAS90652.1 MAG TPA: cell division protein [Caudoviricetes sp.]